MVLMLYHVLTADFWLFMPCSCPPPHTSVLKCSSGHLAAKERGLGPLRTWRQNLKPLTASTSFQTAREVSAYVHKKTHTGMVIAMPFIESINWKQTKCPLTIKSVNGAIVCEHRK